jgi:hypothetical protein
VPYVTLISVDILSEPNGSNVGTSLEVIITPGVVVVNAVKKAST